MVYIVLRNHPKGFFKILKVFFKLFQIFYFLKKIFFKIKNIFINTVKQTFNIYKNLIYN